MEVGRGERLELVCVGLLDEGDDAWHGDVVLAVLDARVLVENEDDRRHVGVLLVDLVDDALHLRVFVADEEDLRGRERGLGGALLANLLTQLSVVVFLSPHVVLKSVISSSQHSGPSIVVLSLNCGRVLERGAGRTYL